tara:strand:+ start:31071 stop:32291 length:1221 start_codon:yes stop_codon:yes gene_type:complete
MRFYRMKILVLLILAHLGGMTGFSAPAQAAIPEVTEARIGSNQTRTRFVLELTGKVGFSIFTLADPNRVVVDLDEVDWKIGPGGNEGEGLIDRYRYGLFKPGTSRIVLDVTAPVKVDKAFILPPKGKYPHRLVIDLKKTSVKNFVAGVRKPTPIKKTVATRPPDDIVDDIRAQRQKKLIVIDPGHGGHDPGNLGIPGKTKYPEKTVTLFAAKALKRELERTGRYEVILTRDRDIFLNLRARPRIAHVHQADLFISIHADAIKDRRVRGATVYTLSEKASDREAAALARRENKSDIIAGIDLEAETDEVQTILIDLLQRETMNLSSRLAAEIVPQLKRVVTVRTRPHRTANLAVLKGLDVPSVLIELGYLTNETDARLLMQKETQQNIARSLVRAIDRYFQKNFVAY